jgi:hypothetical protein
MKKMRLVLLLVALASTFGLTTRRAYALCSGGQTLDCENVCEPRQENCQAGLNHPECGGDYTCCHNALSACWNCCVWF